MTPTWLRVALQTLTLPLIVAPGLGFTLPRHLRPVTAPPVHTSVATIHLPVSDADPVQPAPNSRPIDAGSTDQDGTTDAVTALLELQNRAERRAKGRGKSATQVSSARGKVSAPHGPAHTQRNWANRRSG